MPTLPLAISMPGGFEWVFIGGIALLLFGKRLPDVARSFGKSVVEFKRGIKGLDEDIDAEADRPSTPRVERAPQAKLDQPID